MSTYQSIPATFSIYCRTKLYDQKNLYRVCNYGFNSYIEGNTLKIYSLFKPFTKPFPTKKTFNIKLHQQLLLQFHKQKGYLFIINDFNEEIKQGMRFKKLLLQRNENGQVSITPGQIKMTVPGFITIFQTQQPQNLQNSIMQVVVGKFRLTLINRWMQVSLSNYFINQQMDILFKNQSRTKQELIIKQKKFDIYSKMRYDPYQIIFGYQEEDVKEKIQQKLQVTRKQTEELLQKVMNDL